MAPSISLTPDGVVYKLVQFQQLPSEAEIESLKQRGVELLYYISNNAYWAAVETAPGGVTALSRLHRNDGLIWSMSSSRVNKLAPEVQLGVAPPYAVLENGQVVLLVSVFPDVDGDYFRDSIQSVGGGLLDSPYPNVHRIMISPLRIYELSAINAIEWIEWDNPPKETHNVGAAQRIESNVIRQAPYFLSGQGVLVGVWDQSRVFPHTDFGNRLSIGDGSFDSNHATHVAGTIGGAGVLNANALGMAPAIHIRSYDWLYDLQQMHDGYDLGIRLSNHSYGFVVGWYWDSGWKFMNNTNLFGSYISYSRGMDQVVTDKGLIVFKIGRAHV